VGNGIRVGHDPVVVALQDADGPGDRAQVLGLVRLRERLDALVVRLAASAWRNPSKTEMSMPSRRLRTCRSGAPSSGQQLPGADQFSDRSLSGTPSEHAELAEIW
jgi:hypothetical protein